MPLVNVEGVGQLKFPEGMSDADMTAAIQKNFGTPEQHANNPALQADNQPNAGGAMLSTAAKALANAIMPGVGQVAASAIPSNKINQAGNAAMIGLGSGFMKAGQGLKGLYLQAKDAVEPGSITSLVTGMTPYQQYQKDTDAEHAFFDSTPVGKSFSGKAGDFVGQALPYLIPGTNAVKGAEAISAAPKIAEGAMKAYAKLMGKNALINGGISAMQYVPEGGSRTANTLMGTALGAFIPPVVSGLSSANPYIKGGTAAGLGLIGNNVAGDGTMTGDAEAMAGTAMLPFAPEAAMRLLGRESPTLNKIAAAKMLAHVDPEKAIAGQQAANRLDPNFTLTPAEASGSQIAGAAQGQLGRTDNGAEALFKFGENRQGVQKNIVDNFLSSVAPTNNIVSGDVRDIAKGIQSSRENVVLGNEQSKIQNLLDTLAPDNTDVSNEIRSTSQKIIKDKEQALQQKAEPFYTAAENKKIAPSQLKSLMNSDPNIENAINGVLNDDKYAYTLKGFAPNSIKVLDLAKKRLNAQANNFLSPLSEGNDRYIGGLLSDSAKRLTQATDRFSQDYKMARSIYSEDHPALDQLKESNIGKIAHLDDTQLKNVSKIIFDPSQTNLNIIGDIRDHIAKANPDLWKGLIRNEIERRVNTSTPDQAGSFFYNKVIGNQRDYNQFMAAAKGFPEIQTQLRNMRTQFSQSDNVMASLQKTHLAKIAKMDDTQTKKLSQTIFDSSQTDDKVLENYRDQISSASPEKWNTLVRNEMERRLDQMGEEGDNFAGSNFYSKILKKDSDFNKFMLATKNIPGANQKLKDMRLAFRNLMNPVSAVTANRNARSNMSGFRDAFKTGINSVYNLLGGHYDQAAIKLITSNKWDKEFNGIRSESNSVIRGQKLGALLGKIANLGTNKLTNSGSSRGK